MTERSLNDIPYEVKESVRESINAIRNAIGKNATLMAATKTVPVEIINYAITECGLTDIGENRVQELLSKYDALEKDKVNLHFIGTLQANKVKYIVDKVCLIHSLDSVKLAEEISKRSLKIGKVTECLCEINIGDEEAKGGISESYAEEFIRSVSMLEGIRIRGIMVIGPHCESTDDYIPFFERTKALFDDLSGKGLLSKDPILSMGMSDNYSLAVKHGSTLVRPGSAIFGARKYV
jgi:pyridoxal phosphate enzyme (YggS family)